VSELLASKAGANVSPEANHNASNQYGSRTELAADRLEFVPINRLTPYKDNARTHSRKQIRQIADSIERFGFTNPVLIDDGGGIIAGHGRVKAAKLLGLNEVPALRLSHLSESEKRAYVLVLRSHQRIPKSA
jgi:ParB-like chromosome segregation protein Spo0J